MKMVMIIISIFLGLTLEAKTQRITPPSKEEMSLTCRNAEIHIPSPLGDSVEKESGVICYNKVLNRMTSKNCKESCELDMMVRKIKPPLEYKGVGTPGAILCEKAGGQSQVVFLVIDQEKIKIDRCLHKKEFVSLGFLFHRWSSKIK